MSAGDTGAGPADGLPLAIRRPAMATVLIAVGLSSIDTVLAYTALPSIAGDLGITRSASIWVANGYQFAMIATLLPFAALGDVIGHRRLQLAGLAAFSLAALGAGLAASLAALVAARVLQGVGSGAMIAVSAALIGRIYPARLLGRGIGLYALMVSVFMAAGPPIASAVLTVGSWRLVFLVHLPFGIAALVIGWRSLPGPDGPLRRRIDWLSTLLATAAGGLATLALGEAAHGGAPVRIAAEVGAAIACGTLAVRRQRGHPAPILPVDLFRRPVFALSAGAAFLAFTAQALAFASLPFLLQDKLGRAPGEIGLLLLPWPAVVAAMAPIAGRLSERFPAGGLGGIGLATLAAGLALLALLGEDAAAHDIALRVGLCGIGFGFYQAPNIRAIMTGAPPERRGGASGIVAVARVSGQGTGAALTALCLAHAADGPTLALALGAGVAAAATLVSLARLGGKA